MELLQSWLLHTTRRDEFMMLRVKLQVLPVQGLPSHWSAWGLVLRPLILNLLIHVPN